MKATPPVTDTDDGEAGPAEDQTSDAMQDLPGDPNLSGYRATVPVQDRRAGTFRVYGESDNDSYHLNPTQVSRR